MQILNSIETFCAAAAGISTSQSEAQGDISEAIPLGSDKPMLRVWLENWETSVNNPTDRKTFGAGIRETAMVVNVDVYVRARSWIGEDLQAVIVQADAIQTKLETITRKPYFGLAGIQAFKWRGEIVTFPVDEVKYSGFRIILDLEVF